MRCISLGKEDGHRQKHHAGKWATIIQVPWQRRGTSSHGSRIIWLSAGVVLLLMVAPIWLPAYLATTMWKRRRGWEHIQLRLSEHHRMTLGVLVMNIRLAGELGRIGSRYSDAEIAHTEGNTDAQ